MPPPLRSPRSAPRPSHVLRPAPLSQGISLTGWVALLGIASCVVLVMFGVALVIRRLRGGPTDGYTLVVKK